MPRLLALSLSIYIYICIYIYISSIYLSIYLSVSLSLSLAARIYYIICARARLAIRRSFRIFRTSHFDKCTILCKHVRACMYSENCPVHRCTLLQEAASEISGDSCLQKLKKHAVPTGHVVWECANHQPVDKQQIYHRDW